MSTYAADVCLRSGKWYYEVELLSVEKGVPAMSVGWLAPKAVPGQYHLGGDGTGASWGFSLSARQFNYAGSGCPLPFACSLRPLLAFISCSCCVYA